MDQIQKIISILGTPTKDDLSFVSNQEAKNFVLKLPKRTKLKLENVLPNSNPIALDLLLKMLTFNPDKRITVEECLLHPYFEEISSPEDEIVSKYIFDWDFDHITLSKENLQNLIYKEAVNFKNL